MSSEDAVRELQNQIRRLSEGNSILRAQLGAGGIRPVEFGRDRFSLWGTLDDDLPAGGSADVTIKKYNGATWDTVGVMEDVLAPPIMADDTTIAEGAWVRVEWFPADGSAYVTGGSCPTEDDSSSGG